MSFSSSDQRRLADTRRRMDVERLLFAYPAISREERAEVLRFLKAGPVREIGLLVCNDAVKPALERFRADHRREIVLEPTDLFLAVGMVIGIVLACVLLLDVGRAP